MLNVYTPIHILTADFITIGPSGAFYTHGRTFGSTQATAVSSSDSLRNVAGGGAPFESLTRRCRLSDITARVRVKRVPGAYRYENSCQASSCFKTDIIDHLTVDGRLFRSVAKSLTFVYEKSVIKIPDIRHVVYNSIPGGT